MAKGGRLKTALDTHRLAQKRREREAAAADARHRKEQSIIAGRSGKAKAQKSAAAAAVHTTAEEDGDGAEAQAGESTEGRSSSIKRQRRPVQPFAADDTVLLVGEGNFSFALSLLRPPHSHPPPRLLATAYDSEAECYRKYPDARGNVEAIRAMAGRKEIVVFGVDAGALDKCKEVTGGVGAKSKGKARSEDGEVGADSRARWSKVWFGFPHVGAGHKDETRNILANQLMLLRFFISVAPFLTRGALPAYAVPGERKKGRSDDDDDGEDDMDADSLGRGTDGLDPADEVQMSDAEGEGEYLPSTAGAEILAQARFVPPARRGSVLVTLRNAAPYTNWIVPTLARRLLMLLAHIASSAPSLPRGQTAPTTEQARSVLRAAGCPSNASYAVWRSFEFEPEMWVGYSHRRTVGWVEGLSTGDNEDILRRPPGASTKGGQKASKAGGGECRTWEFGLEVQDTKPSKR